MSTVYKDADVHYDYCVLRALGLYLSQGIKYLTHVYDGPAFVNNDH